MIPPRTIAFAPPVGVKAKTGEWVSAAWTLVTADWLTYGFIAIIGTIVSGAVPLILAGPIAAGYHLVFVRRLLGRKPELADLFLGFNFFVPTMIAGVLIGVFTGLASLFCLIPGLVVAAMYMFSYLFIVDKKMDFWPAMQASHAVVKQDYVGFSVFLLALIGINLLGLLCCVVGLLVTAPLSYAATTIAYRDVVGFEPGVELAQPQRG
ncbi:MAG: hypothetical protein NTY38_16875 [Acidobacteria bacterium]|nr:hypothetical protein [Acidobacteriota bacterium]